MIDLQEFTYCGPLRQHFAGDLEALFASPAQVEVFLFNQGFRLDLYRDDDCNFYMVAHDGFGWKVTADGAEHDAEFANPHRRG